MGILNTKDRASLTTADIYADAQRKLEIIRQFVSDFSDADNLAELTSNQLRIAGRTQPAYLRKAAVVADAQALSGYPAGAAQLMRAAADAEEAYKPLVVALADALRLVQIAIARVKLDGADAARIVRKVATTYSRTPQGAGLRETVDDMRATKRRPVRREKKKADPPPSLK
ncbi:MAG TPA: hypothetical protein VGF28_21955 [Thermoanaerobaculia bacterium]|jgi:hypothetical protein